MIELERLLRSQGFGSRAECRALVYAGHVSVHGRLCDDPRARFAPEGLRFVVDGESWTYRRLVYLALNKPAGYECSRQPTHHPSVYSLLPIPLVRRGVQTVGRLDADATGLLLLSDDGAFLHACTSPRRMVPKIYEVSTRHAVDDGQLAALLAGVVLRDEPQAIRVVGCDRLGERRLRLTLTLGKYHLVKRMVAAAGNRVEALHRVAIGGFALPTALPFGRWMWLEAADVARLTLPTCRGGVAGLAEDGRSAGVENGCSSWDGQEC